MEFIEALRHDAVLLESVFDLTAFCYDYIVKNVDDQAAFIGKYIIENDQAYIRNPNLRNLRRFDEKVFQILRRQEEEGILFRKCLENVIESSEKMQSELDEYGDDFLNCITVPFFILLAVDRYVIEKKGHITETAPLNKGYRNRSFVYLNIQDNLLDMAKEENGFPDVIGGVRIRNYLYHLCIMEHRELAAQDAEPPKMVSLWMEENDGFRKKMLLGKKLKIAVIPLDNEPMLRFPVDEGALFHVEYRDGYLERCESRAIRLLELAIDRKANIIVFPEFVCSQEIQGAIQHRLQQIYQENPDRLKNLLIVLAGSGWIDGDNVAAIFSYDGKLLGKQYKTERFSDLKEEGRELIENLQNPGKETIIIDAEGLGKIAVGICRDICNQDYIERLTEIFCPQLLLVPAWSRSIVRGFENQLKEITVHNHITCSVLCDCCEAMNSQAFREEIGMLVTPVKRRSLVEGKVCCIRRKAEKCEHCQKGGCIILATICFESDHVKRGRMVTQPKQINCC